MKKTDTVRINNVKHETMGLPVTLGNCIPCSEKKGQKIAPPVIVSDSYATEKRCVVALILTLKPRNPWSPKGAGTLGR